MKEKFVILHGLVLYYIICENPLAHFYTCIFPLNIGIQGNSEISKHLKHVNINRTVLKGGAKAVPRDTYRPTLRKTSVQLLILEKEKLHLI